MDDALSYHSKEDTEKFTLDFDYDDDDFECLKKQQEKPNIPYHSEIGEFHGDTHTTSIPISKSLYMFTFCAALNSCNLGYDIGVNTSVAPLLQDDMELSDVQLEIFMGSLNLFAMIGALCAQFISDGLGRRRAFQASAIVFIFGVMIMSMSMTYGMLLFGRIFVGLGVGFGLAIDPIYISEISPASHRGELVTWSEIAINMGLVFGFSSGLIFSGLSDDIAWRFMFATGAFMPTMLILLVAFIMPESPRWLVAKGRKDDATEVLHQIYPPDFPVERIVDDIHETIECERKAEHAVGWDVIMNPSPAFRRMLIVGIGSAAAQQLVGIEAIQYYLVFIIEESGVQDPRKQSHVLIFLGLLKAIFILLAGSNFDKRGRRPFILVSVGGMAFALLMQSFNFMSAETNGNFAIFSLALYLLFFSVGMGPGAWLIASEVFSTSIRAKAMSLATFTNRFVGAMMASSFLSMANALTWAGFFLLLAIVCLLIGIFFYCLVPETKGRSLEDMTLYFAEITNDRSILDVDGKKQAGDSETESSEEGLEMHEQQQSNAHVSAGTFT